MQKLEKQMKKILLMGRRCSGKTAMQSIIFANYEPKDTRSIGFTVEIEDSKIQFLDDLTLDLWDCGGAYMKQWLTTEKNTVFKNVEALIYVFKASNEGQEFENDMKDYKLSLENLRNLSRNAPVFIFINIIDQIQETERQIFINKKKDIILEASKGVQVKGVFETQIFDYSLYKAWSEIIKFLLPDQEIIKASLNQFCAHSGCDEGIVETMQFSGSGFNVLIEEFTDKTFIMVVFSDPKLSTPIIQQNIQCARQLYNQKQNTNNCKNSLFTTQL